MKEELELYIHIPFCVKKCAYCDFLSGPQSPEVIEKYVEALVKEIEAYKVQEVEAYKVQEILAYREQARKEQSETRHASEIIHEFEVTTIFLGGGTPSLLEPTRIQQIFAALRNAFQISEHAEITIEANPGTVTREKLEAYKQVGINRISFGLQSANNEELKLLGRIHTFEEFLESYYMARACGFDNINIDLISAIPKQTLQSWEKTLRKIIALNPEHVSAYSLMIEEGTPFAAVYGEGTVGAKELPSEEEERRIYQRTGELLSSAGYHRYEISNYAKKGKECKHNLGYWERKNYLGLGLGASSLIENVRYKNIDDLDVYIRYSGNLSDIQEHVEHLTKTEQMEEFLFLGLRKMEGISEVEFARGFQQTLADCYGENIARMRQENLLTMENGHLRLTQRGIDISNYVFAELLS